jgi:hypothetical protein
LAICRKNKDGNATTSLIIENNLFVDCGNMDSIKYHKLPGVGGIAFDGWGDVAISYNTNMLVKNLFGLVKKLLKILEYEMRFTETNLLHLVEIVGIMGIEIALIITGNDGTYALF